MGPPLYPLNMRIWLITIGEPLPTDPETPRLLRTGMLAEQLVSRGHEVTWWSSTFNHSLKKERYTGNTRLNLKNGVRLNLLHGRRYVRNISFRRILNHMDLASEFKTQSAQYLKPDIILTSFPTIELSAQAVHYGKCNQVPVIVDIRDLWPDIFLDLVPTSMRALAKIPLHSLIRATKYTLSSCSGIVGISQNYLDWGLRYANRDQLPLDKVFPLGYQPPNFGEDEISRGGLTLTKLGVDPTKTICWFVGTFGKTYDLEPAIMCAKQYQAKHPNVQFVFSGDGERREKWERTARNLSNVIFTGWVGGKEIAWMLQNAKIGLAAYAYGAPQGLPNKIFEYMAAGIPILSSLQGECRDLLASNACGATYRADDSNSFSQELDRFLNPDHRTKMGKQGKKVFEKNYSATIVYAKFMDYLETVSED